MKIKSESTDEHLESMSPEDREKPTIDIRWIPPFAKWLDEDEERDATTTLFGSLLDGGYEIGPE